MTAVSSTNRWIYSFSVEKLRLIPSLVGFGFFIPLFSNALKDPPSHPVTS